MIPTDLTLRDGRQVHLRATTAADEAEILQGFERLSAHSRYMRLMHVAHEPDVALLRSVLASFPERGVGVVATIPADDGIDIVGSATAVFAPDGAHCEFAVTVADTFCGVGLASALMRALMDEARAHGMREMVGYVLAENAPMLALARSLGFSNEPDPGDHAVRVVRKALVEGD